MIGVRRTSACCLLSFILFDAMPQNVGANNYLHITAMSETLFKYQPFNIQSLANLKNRTLWFSSPSSFNDPFDCAVPVLPKDMSEEDFHRAIEYFEREHGLESVSLNARDQFGKPSAEFRQVLVPAVLNAIEGEDSFYRRRGVACLTKRADEMLLWAHYADGHRGFCLEFDGTDEPFSRARPVQYSDDLPSVNIINVLSEQNGDAVFDAMLLTKAKCWAYEDEWRVIHAEENKAYTYPWQKLKAVYFGAAMPEEHVEIIALLLQGSPTKLYRMEKLDGKFAVHSVEVQYSPFKYGATDV